VAAGLQRSLAVFEQNEQLRGRFGTPIKFGPLEWEIETDQINFRAFIKAMKKDLSEFTFSGEDCSFARRIHWASYGLIGYTMKIVRGAAKLVPLTSMVLVHSQTGSKSMRRRLDCFPCRPIRSAADPLDSSSQHNQKEKATMGARWSWTSANQSSAAASAYSPEPGA
jgi:hypothetical protein